VPGEEDRFYADLGRRVRTRRRELQLSQESLATKLNLKRTSITNLERGHQRISAFTFLKLAKCLGIPLNELVERSQPTSELEALFSSNMPDSIRLWIEGAVAPRNRPKGISAAKS